MRCFCSNAFSSAAADPAAVLSISSSPLCVRFAVGALMTSLTECLRLAARTLSAIAFNSGVRRSSFVIPTISAGPIELDEILERKMAFVLRLKWSERNLVMYLVLGPRTFFASTSLKLSNMMSSTDSANLTQRSSSSVEVLDSAAEKTDWKRVASCLTQWVRVLSLVGVDVIGKLDAPGVVEVGLRMRGLGGGESALFDRRLCRRFSVGYITIRVSGWAVIR